MIGRSDLRALDIYADPVMNHLINRTKLEVIAVATKDSEISTQFGVQIQSVPAKSAAVAVTAAQREEFNQKVLHLTTIQQWVLRYYRMPSTIHATVY